ncbi:MAG TPA: hypothetical protein VEQ87_18070 [Burkholderiales bacterium]|nr:hypothetical protein [Burkholderiales bacterium]
MTPLEAALLFILCVLPFHYRVQRELRNLSGARARAHLHARQVAELEFLRRFYAAPYGTFTPAILDCPGDIDSALAPRHHRLARARRARRAASFGQMTKGGTHMMDLVFLGLSIAFFAATIGMAYLFEQLREAKK